MLAVHLIEIHVITKPKQQQQNKQTDKQRNRSSNLGLAKEGEISVILVISFLKTQLKSQTQLTAQLWLIDFNDMLTSLILVYAKRLGNHVNCTFIIWYFV